MNGKMSLRTVQRRLKEKGLLCCIAARKPMVSQKNRRARLAWAAKHASWDAKKWCRVAFSDESRFCRVNVTSNRLVYRKKQEKYAPYATMQTLQGGGGSVTVWGVITYKGAGPIKFLDGHLNGRKYIDLLDNVFVPYYENEMRIDSIFQQDNAPAHRSSEVQCYMEQKMPTILEWPAQSPDINPIENVWHRMKRGLKNCHTSKS